MTMPPTASTVYIVDDDEAVRDSLRWLLEANTYRVKSFASAEAFLAEYREDQAGVLIVDVRMPGMSGLQLQEELLARKSHMPVVFITGHGDVPMAMAVNTMKKGAVDFLEKPFNETDLRDIVSRMFEIANDNLQKQQSKRAHEAMLGRLTAREQQVLERIVAGRLNKRAPRQHHGKASGHDRGRPHESGVGRRDASGVSNGVSDGASIRLSICPMRTLAAPGLSIFADTGQPLPTLANTGQHLLPGRAPGANPNLLHKATRHSADCWRTLIGTRLDLWSFAIDSA